MAQRSGRVQTAQSRRSNGALISSSLRSYRELQGSRVLDFRILGPLEVVGEDGASRSAARSSGRCWAVLVVRAGQVVSTDRLLDELWGEQPPKTATTSLQNLVSQLRKLLGPDVLVTRPPGYVLRVEPDSSTSSASSGWSPSARPARCERRTLREALALWRGPPLADLGVRALRRGRDPPARGAPAGRARGTDRRRPRARPGRSELVPELEALVERYPLRERLRRQLMLALYRSGRQAEALEVYHDVRQRSPTSWASTRARAEAALRVDPAAGGGAEPGAAPAAEDHYGDVLTALVPAASFSCSGRRQRRRGVDGGLPAYAEIAATSPSRSDIRRRAPRPRPRVPVRRADEGRRPALRRAPRALRPGVRPGPVHRALAEARRAAPRGGAPGS